MPEFKRTVDFDVEVKRRGDAALQVVIDGEGGEVVWFPYSQICDSSELEANAQEGDTGTITVSEWIAMQRELI
jgi:hypothetical protein